MDITILISIFFVLGLCFGSFSTVLIERWHSKKGGILLGRSECPGCHHTLSAIELIPLLSYIIQGGKCRNCKKKISLFYPLSELMMGVIFATMAWIGLSFGYVPTDIMWWIFIVGGFITGVYILYDLRYMEIPDQVLVPGIYATLLLMIVGIFFEGSRVQFDLFTYQSFHTFLTDHISGAILLYSFIFLQILIPGGFYLLKHGEKKELLSLGLSYFLLPIIMLIELFRKPSTETGPEIPTWVGGGDLRVALFIGLTLGSIHGIASFFFAYIIGSIVGIFILIKNRKEKNKNNSQIPFGPFLGIGWFLSLLTYDYILSLLNI